MNKIILPKFPEPISLQKQYISLREIFTEFMKMRIEAEEEYSKGLQKAMNKIQGFQQFQDPFGIVLKGMKTNLFERIEQVKNYAGSLKSQQQTLEGKLKESQEKMMKAITQLKIYEKELKKQAEKINRNKVKTEEEIRQIDEKIILSAIGKLNKPSTTNFSTFVTEENELKSNFEGDLSVFRKNCENLRKKIKKREKVVKQENNSLKNEYIDWVKKIFVQEVSLIRNIQYDIDNMIKATKVFDFQMNGEKEEKQASFSLELKKILDVQIQILDPYEKMKKVILSKEKQVQAKVNLEEEINEETAEKYVQNLSQNYSLHVPILSYIESFRLKNIYKFEKEKFQRLSKIFQKFLSVSYLQRDFSTLNKLILYGSSYCCQSKENQKVVILDAIKKQHYLSDLYFWKFLLFSSIKQTVEKCSEFQSQRQIHVQNNVFSNLVSTSLNMIGCGIEKHEVKNTIAKISKVFGLEENHTNNLIKFIESGHASFRKAKK